MLNEWRVSIRENKWVLSQIRYSTTQPERDPMSATNYVMKARENRLAAIAAIGRRGTVHDLGALRQAFVKPAKPLLSQIGPMSQRAA